MVMDFPLIYSNGCSYSDPNYASGALISQTYADIVSQLLGGFALIRSQMGSCNRRIIRSSVHDLLMQREHNPTQKIIALIQLTFEIRDELWIDDIEQDSEPSESNFRTHQFSGQPDWKHRLLNLKDINVFSPYNINKKYLTKWSEGRAFFYSPYAERINLLTDIIMFTSLMEKHNIQFLIFQGPKAELLTQEYMLDFLKAQTTDQRIFNFETFSFCDWCKNNNFDLLDSSEPADIGHYGIDAHAEFAKQVLIPQLKITGQI